VTFMDSIYKKDCLRSIDAKDENLLFF